MFESLQEGLHGALRRLSARGATRPEEVDAALAEVRAALIEADVALPAARALVEGIRRRLFAGGALEALDPAAAARRAALEETAALLGHGAGDPPFARGAPPAVVLALGLQGSGKTTTAAKVARRLSREARAPVAVASLDFSRPAAEEQLRLVALAEPADGARVILLEREGAGPAEAAASALARARASGAAALVLDTAGRTAADAPALAEAAAVAAAAPPDEVLLVADALTGQDALETARRFAAAVEPTGFALTRAEGDARGGAALSFRFALGRPVRFLGTGEGPDALEAFDPERVAARVLGLGDAAALLEAAAAKSAPEGARARRAARRAAKGRFDLDDLAAQLERLSGEGAARALIEALPRALRARVPEAAVPDARAVRRRLAILSSMTPEERRRPEILQASRKRRVARGAGASVAEVNRLLDAHRAMRDALKRGGGGAGALPPGLAPGA